MSTTLGWFENLIVSFRIILLEAGILFAPPRKRDPSTTRPRWSL